MVDLDYLLPLVLSTPGMHLSSSTSLSTPHALENASISIRYRNPLPERASIWSPEYQPHSFIPLTTAADTFPSGGRQGFLAWLKSRCVLSATDAVEQHHGQDEIWRKFVGCFVVLGSMIHYVCFNLPPNSSLSSSLVFFCCCSSISGYIPPWLILSFSPPIHFKPLLFFFPRRLGRVGN